MFTRKGFGWPGPLGYHEHRRGLLPMNLLTLLSFALTNQQIEFKPIVGTAPTIVTQLAEASGMKLTTNKNVANDVIAVSAPKATPREIMDQIAYTLQAEWKEVGGEWTLARSEQQIKDQAAEHRKVNIDLVRKALAKMPKFEPWKDEAAARTLALQIETFERQSGNDFAHTNYTAVREKMPEARLINQILTAIPAEALADVPFNGRVIYSSHPNRLQKPLPIAVKGPIDQFIRENQMLIDAYEGTSTFENARYFGRPQPVKSVSKVILTGKRESLGGLEFHLLMLDEEGSEVGMANKNIEMDLNSDFMKPPGRLSNDDVVVELKPLSKELLDGARTMMEGRNMEMSRSVIEFLRMPKKNELLSMINIEAVEAMAKAEGKPVAIALPELQLFVIMALAADGKVSLKRYQDSLLSSGVVRSEKDGWICFREVDPHLGRIRRVDRTTYQDFCQRIVREQRNSLDAFAEFVYKHPTRAENTLLPIVMMISGTYPSNFQYQDDLNMVRLYATLNEAQKRSLATGNPHKIGDFTTAQQKIISEMMYGQRLRNYSYSSSIPMEAGAHVVRKTTESTEVYPNGLQEPFQITAKVTDNPSWFVLQTYGEARPTDPRSIAWESYTRERPDLFPYVTQFGNEQGSYAEGQARSWMFTLRIAKDVTSDVELVDHALPGKDKFVKMDKLPGTLKTEVDKMIKEFREQYKNTKPGEFGVGRGSPPPSR